MTDRITDTTDEQRVKAQRALDRAQEHLAERARVERNLEARLTAARAQTAHAVTLRDYARAHPALTQPTLPTGDDPRPITLASRTCDPALSEHGVDCLGCEHCDRPA